MVAIVVAAATPAAYAVSPKPLTSSSLIGATGNVDNSRFSPLRFLQGTEEVHDDHDHQHHDDHKDELNVEVRVLCRSSHITCIIYPIINSHVSLSSFT